MVAALETEVVAALETEVVAALETVVVAALETVVMATDAGNEVAMVISMVSAMLVKVQAMRE